MKLDIRKIRERDAASSMQDLRMFPSVADRNALLAAYDALVKRLADAEDALREVCADHHEACVCPACRIAFGDNAPATKQNKPNESEMYIDLSGKLRVRYTAPTESGEQ